jgi:hypothetical protein
MVYQASVAGGTAIVAAGWSGQPVTEAGDGYHAVGHAISFVESEPGAQWMPPVYGHPDWPEVLPLAGAAGLSAAAFRLSRRCRRPGDGS